jgi:hypothetical protein
MAERSNQLYVLTFILQCPCRAQARPGWSFCGSQNVHTLGESVGSAKILGVCSLWDVA